MRGTLLAAGLANERVHENASCNKGEGAVVINRLCRRALVGLGVLLAFLSALATRNRTLKP